MVKLASKWNKEIYLCIVSLRKIYGQLKVLVESSNNITISDKGEKLPCARPRETMSDNEKLHSIVDLFV